MTPGRDFRGELARKYGARWNRPGTDVIYAAATLALATLEFFVHLDRRRIPSQLAAHVAEIPGDVAIERVDLAALPVGWERYPGSVELQDIGTRWAARRSSLLLAVPTAVLPVPRDLIPAEVNYLIDPSHPDFGRVGVRTVRYELDPRMWGGH